MTFRNKIKELLKQQQRGTASFLLYTKMTDDVAQMAGIQDSLFDSRFQLEALTRLAASEVAALKDKEISA